MTMKIMKKHRFWHKLFGTRWQITILNIESENPIKGEWERCNVCNKVLSISQIEKELKVEAYGKIYKV